MKVWIKAVAVTCLIALGGLTAANADIADSEQAQRLDNATSILQQFVNIPENRVPQALLNQAYGIAVIPSVLKISFLGGVQHGNGVLSVRTRDGGWSDPTFVSLTGGSIGFQAGVSSTDIILVFKTQRSIDRIADGQISLGADASVAAGPVGRSVGASTNMDFNAEVYSYSRSRGLFGGVSLGGARIGIDKDSNWLFYDEAGIKARTLLTRDSGNSLPSSAQRFIYTLNQYMPRSDNQFSYSANTGNDSQQQPQQSADQDGQYNNQYGNGQNGSQNNGQSGGYVQPGPSVPAGNEAPSNGQTRAYGNGQGNSQNNGITVQQGAGNTPNNGSGQSGMNQNGTSDYTGDSSNYGGNYGSQNSANDNRYDNSQSSQGY